MFAPSIFVKVNYVYPNFQLCPVEIHVAPILKQDNGNNFGCI